MNKKRTFLFLFLIIMLSLFIRTISQQSYTDRSIFHNHAGEYQLVADTGLLNVPPIQRIRKSIDANMIMQSLKWFCSVDIAYLLMNKPFLVHYDKPIDLRGRIQKLIPVYFNGSKYKDKDLPAYM